MFGLLSSTDPVKTAREQKEWSNRAALKVSANVAETLLSKTHKELNFFVCLFVCLVTYTNVGQGTALWRQFVSGKA